MSDNTNFSLALLSHAVNSEWIWAYVARYSKSITLAWSGIAISKVSES